MAIEDTIETVGILREAGIDYVCVSAGAISSDARIKAYPGYLVPYASRIRQETAITTFVTGMIIEPEQAEEAIADGHADMVAIARGFLDDPRWVWHAAEKLGAEITIPMQYWQVKNGAWAGAELLRGTRQAAE